MGVPKHNGVEPNDDKARRRWSRVLDAHNQLKLVVNDGDLIRWSVMEHPRREKIVLPLKQGK